MLDDAPGGLLETLYARTRASQPDVKWLYQSDADMWVAVTFVTEDPSAVPPLIASFLEALRHTTPVQRRALLAAGASSTGRTVAPAATSGARWALRPWATVPTWTPY
ncbi:hypothetical protein WDV93_14965 [Pantoea ananatis]